MRRIGIILSVLLLAGVVGATSAQAYNLVVMPSDVVVPRGGSVQFRAQLFTDAGVAVVIDQYNWRVMPDTLGEISQDGYFVAGKHAGEGRIVVTATLSGTVIVGEAKITVGELTHPGVVIVVRPKRAIVPPGGEQQFEAKAFDRNGHSLPIQHLRWKVVPQSLGEISADGLFRAANHVGYGSVVAIAEINNEVHRGAAEVIVSGAATGAIAGIVKDEATGEPLVDAKVRAQRVGRIPWHRVVRTDSSGQYLLDRLIPGMYVVYAAKRGYVGEFYNNTRVFSEATPVQVAENDTTAGIDFDLTAGAKISGMVADQADGTPLGGAHVTARLILKPHLTFHAVSSGDGSYTIEGLPAGSYIVSARLEGYAREYYDNVSRPDQATPVSVTPPNEVTGIDFTLSKSSAISGRVTDAITGEPLVEARIRVLALIGNHPLFQRQTVTDSSGEYVISVPPGFYLVYADRKGYRGEFYDDVVDPLQATPVQVTENEHVTGIDFGLLPLGSISGKVVDQETGQPIVGALVGAFPERFRPYLVAIGEVDPGVRARLRGLFARTDSTGSYTIDGLPAGTYFVGAVAEGYLPEFWQEAATIGDATPVEVNDGVETTGIDFTLTHGGAIAGFVFSKKDSLPVSGAVVRVRLKGTGFVRIGYTDDTGAYKVRGLPTGSYYVYADAEGFVGQYYDGVFRKSEATLVEVTAPNVTEGIDFYLPSEPTDRSFIAGHLTNQEDGTPIPGGIIVAIPLGRGRAHFAISGPLGGYRIPGLLPGSYVVLAWAPGFVAEFYDNARNWRKATPVVVPPSRTDIDFALRPRPRGPYHVRGRVVSSRDGSPLVGVAVYAEQNGQIVASAVSDDDGEYVIPEIPAGRYKIWASGTSLNDSYYGGSGPDDATDVAVGSGSSADGVDLAMQSDVTSVEGQNSGAAVPDRFELLQNYPNPFNPSTTIKYQLPQATQVRITVYNLLGQKVRTLVDAPQEAGLYAIQWDGRNDLGQPVSSGTYLYRIEAGPFKAVKKMVLLK